MSEIYNYLQNYVEIKITGYKPQRFVNICLKRYIKIWKLTQISEEEYTMCISVSDFKCNVKNIAAKTHVKVEILSKNGIVFEIKKYKHRKLLAVVMILMVLFFVYLSSVVWNISIEGADAESRQNITVLLDEMGVKKGSLMSRIKSKQLAEQLLSKQKNLAWVGVKKQGTTLRIELIETVIYEEKKHDNIPNDEPCDIAVSKDCLLYKVSVSEGDQIVKTGNTALSGQTVVVGNGKHAEAEIWGCVWYKAEIPVEDKVEEMVYTGKNQKKSSIILFGIKLETPNWKWLPWNWKREEYENYDTLYYENYLGGEKSLPLGRGVEIQNETVLKTKVLDEKEADIYAISEAQSVLDATIPEEAKILSTTGKFKTMTNGKKYYVMTVEVLENVGITVSQ